MSNQDPLIETYRTYDIRFDTQEETFYAVSLELDNQQTGKKSYASVKKAVDDFIKENNNFKPFWIERLPSGWGSEKDIYIKVVGIRKDGRFVFENKKGEKKQLSEYNEKDYVVKNDANELIREGIDKLYQQREALNKLIKTTEASITGIPLADIKAKYSI